MGRLGQNTKPTAAGQTVGGRDVSRAGAFTQAHHEHGPNGMGAEVLRGGPASWLLAVLGRRGCNGQTGGSWRRESRGGAGGAMGLAGPDLGRAGLIRPFCITILYHNLLLFIDIFHI
jgi:hypothetical protein